jgi:hypothetical protein
LRKIGDISKVINYYDTSAKNLSAEIQKWVASWESSTTVEAEAIKPTKKKKSESTEA